MRFLWLQAGKLIENITTLHRKKKIPGVGPVTYNPISLGVHVDNEYLLTVNTLKSEQLRH